MAKTAVGILRGVAADRWATEPNAIAKWVAAHRGPVRVVFLILDAAVLSWVVATFINDVARWWLSLQVVLYAMWTWHFGWYIPRYVDKWSNAQRGTAEPKRP